MNQAVGARAVSALLQWPVEGHTRVPPRVFTDPELYAWEQDLIFRGPAWSFLGLAAEIPGAGDYITTFVGDSPIIVVRRPAWFRSPTTPPCRLRRATQLRG